MQGDLLHSAACRESGQWSWPTCCTILLSPRQILQLRQPRSGDNSCPMQPRAAASIEAILFHSLGFVERPCRQYAACHGLCSFDSMSAHCSLRDDRAEHLQDVKAMYIILGSARREATLRYINDVRQWQSTEANHLCMLPAEQCHGIIFVGTVLFGSKLLEVLNGLLFASFASNWTRLLNTHL